MSIVICVNCGCDDNLAHEAPMGLNPALLIPLILGVDGISVSSPHLLTLWVETDVFQGANSFGVFNRARAVQQCRLMIR